MRGEAERETMVKECQHVLGNTEIVSEKQRTIRCKKCGKIFQNTEAQFKSIKEWIKLRDSLATAFNKLGLGLGKKEKGPGR